MFSKDLPDSKSEAPEKKIIPRNIRMKQAMLNIMSALSLKYPKQIMQQGIGNANSQFSLSLVLTEMLAVQHDSVNKINDYRKKELQLPNS